MSNYTIINLDAQKRLRLSPNEYILMDKIFNLSKNPDYGNWCYASKQTLANYLNVSKQTIHTLIKKLEAREYILKNEETKRLRVSIDWFNEVNMQSSKESLLSSKDTLPGDSKDSLPQKSSNRSTFKAKEASFSRSYKDKDNKDSNKTDRQDIYAANRSVGVSSPFKHDSTNKKASNNVDDSKVIALIRRKRPDLKIIQSKVTGKYQIYSKVNQEYQDIRYPRAYLQTIDEEDKEREINNRATSNVLEEEKNISEDPYY